MQSKYEGKIQQNITEGAFQKNRIIVLQALFCQEMITFHDELYRFMTSKGVGRKETAKNQLSRSWKVPL